MGEFSFVNARCELESKNKLPRNLSPVIARRCFPPWRSSTLAWRRLPSFGYSAPGQARENRPGFAMTIEHKTCSIQQFAGTANCGHEIKSRVFFSLSSASCGGDTSNGTFGAIYDIKKLDCRSDNGAICP